MARLSTRSENHTANRPPVSSRAWRRVVSCSLVVTAGLAESTARPARRARTDTSARSEGTPTVTTTSTVSSPTSCAADDARGVSATIAVNAAAASSSSVWKPTGSAPAPVSARAIAYA